MIFNIYNSIFNPASIIIISAVVLFFLIFLLTLSKPIDTIFDRNKKVLFKIFSRRGSFIVYDYTGNGGTLKIEFRTYVDVEAYVSRKKNGWDQLI